MMTTRRIICCTALLIGASLATAFGKAEWQNGEVQTGKGHRFACTDYSGGKVFIVDEQGKVEGIDTDLSKLAILSGKHPQSLFFRDSERIERYGKNYNDWSQQFSRLMGIIGKCMREETQVYAGNSANFTRFKREHPEQLVLLHFNGSARDPQFSPSEKLFAGHWIYRTAAMILSDIPAEPGETDIRVEDARLFLVNKKAPSENDEIGLFAIDANGINDWAHSEQVKLVSVNKENNTIRVRRGMFGTTPRAFKASSARAAAHYAEGPFGKNGNLLWRYNLSTICPSNEDGKTFADLLVEEIGRWYDPGGVLEQFDGLEFDVLYWETKGDTDGDGIEDKGYIDGIQHYGLGVIDFCRVLRQRLGPGRLILADATGGRDGEHSQRAFGILNGIENEGFPHASDDDFLGWSTGINRSRFWNSRSFQPAFSYTAQRIDRKQTHDNFAQHRLQAASAVLMDSGIAQYFQLARDPAEAGVGITDELRMGSARKPGWLGKALGPPIHLAGRTPDIINGHGRCPVEGLLKRFSGDGLTIVESPETAGAIQVSGKPGQSYMNFTLHDIPAKGPDLFITLRAKAAATKRHGTTPRLFWVYAFDGGQNLLRPDLPETTTISRGKEERLLTQADTGAALRWERVVLDRVTMSAYRVNLPWKGRRGAGATIWKREVMIPSGTELQFMTAMDPHSVGKSDGIDFQVWIAPITNGAVGRFKKIFGQHQTAGEWIQHTASLDQWAGQKVQFRFVADCGSKNNSTADGGYWGDVRIVAGKHGKTKTAETTHMLSQMSYADPQTFTSTFYYPNIGSKTIDLGFTVEGGEAFTIESLTVHAAPDLMSREFEHGLVIANPSPCPENFDLNTISPGKLFRRFEATSKQDSRINNGLSVEGKIVIPPRDALFLVRDHP